MADSVFPRLVSGRLSFVLAAAILVFFDLVPFGFVPATVPAPDLLFALVLVTAVRRPEFVPVWLVIPVFLIADLLFMKPPGLWTAIVFAACAFFAGQEYRLRERGFLEEWFWVTGVMLLAALAERAVLALALLPVPRLGFSLLWVLVTAAAYPVVALVAWWVLRVRHVTPREAVRFGHRL